MISFEIDKSVFSRLVEVKNSVNDEIRTITIVCQQPSNPNTILTPFEIKHSDHLIFIDKTAYNDPLYSFIPENRKSWTYLSVPDDGPNPLDKYLRTDYALKNDEVVFGRGSSFNKCPKDVLAPFNSLKLPYKKKFIIVGVPERRNWLTREIKNKGIKDVVTYPMVGFNDWMKLVSSFDIGLYYLPKDAHSSIDGTLGQMMRIGLPVIVGGAPAPKERIIHGENGYIADTVSEMIKYSEMLANSQELRERIGQKARQTTIELNKKLWVDTLENIIENVEKSGAILPFNIPFRNIIIISFINTLSLLKAWIIRPVSKVLSRK